VPAQTIHGALSAPAPRLPASLEGYRAAGAQLSDAGDILAMLQRFDMALLGELDTTMDDLLSGWRRPGFELARDTLVVRTPVGQTVGYAVVHQGRDGDCFVDPSVKHPSLEAFLIDWILAMARAVRDGGPRPPAGPQASATGAGRTVLTMHALDAESAYHRLLESRGFVHARTFRRMRVVLEAEPKPPRWPTGVSATGVEGDHDIADIYGVIQTAFADIPGQALRSFEFWSATYLERSDFDPTLWTVVRDRDGVAIGAAACFADELGGYIAQLGVASTQRRRGMGMALLLRTFGLFWERGIRSVTLGVDVANDTGAPELYARAGMTPTLVVYRFEREI
jgi:mycothiol synthase